MGYRKFGWATIRIKRQFVQTDNSSQVTIRPEFQKATIRPKASIELLKSCVVVSFRSVSTDIRSLRF